MSLLRRLVILTAAYLCACLLGAAILTVLLFLASEGHAHLTWDDAEGLASYAMVFGCVAAVFGLIPGVIAIVYSERADIRGVRWYALAGGTIGIFAMATFLPLLALSGGNVNFLSFADFIEVVVIVLIAGVLAGVTFWIVAMFLPTKAGLLWRRKPRPIDAARG